MTDPAVPASNASNSPSRRFRLTDREARKLAWGVIIGAWITNVIAIPVATVWLGDVRGYVILMFMSAAVALAMLLMLCLFTTAIAFGAAFIPINPWWRMAIATILCSALAMFSTRFWWAAVIVAAGAGLGGALAITSIRRTRERHARWAAEAAAQAAGQP